MRGDLNSDQLKRALRVAGELAQIQELDEFPRAAARLLRELIPCEHAGYNAIDIGSGHATVVADPAEVVFDGGPEALSQLADQNPIIVRAAAGETNVLRLSDFIARRALHKTELYHEVYRRISLEYQLGVQLPPVRADLGRREELVGLSLARTRRDFTDSDRLLLGEMRPHFAGALERLHELAMLRAAVDTAVGEPGECVLLVDPRDGSVVWASSNAERLLDLAAGAPLPLSLRLWMGGGAVRRGHSDAILVVRNHRVRARLVRDAYPGLDGLHLKVDVPLDAQTLRTLGLTRRQAEVHELALRGYTSEQIATILFLSRRTVEKHFEAIYQRLGVTNRAQAIAGTLAALDR
jgi:DNA-binding CsgD family transcriptional regulator